MEAAQIKYIGVNDKSIDLFEGQYPVPNGVSYNSYLILDERIAVMDTADARAADEWLKNLELALAGRNPDYLIVSHMEPDHAGSLELAARKYPGMQIVGSAKTFGMISQFFDIDLSNRTVTVQEGDEIKLGSRTLRFYMAPMVHWPEVMVTYEASEGILFSADAFGKFGALDVQEEWEDEARRYYYNIVGKYGVQAQALLKKAANLDISAIYPLHGPILKDNLSYYINKYKLWSSYTPEEKGVLIAYASIYGHTAQAAKALSDMLTRRGIKSVLRDLARTDVSYCVADAFKYEKMVLASASYDGGIFPPMEEFLHHLKSKTYRGRQVGIVENGTWAPSAAKGIKELLGQMKDIIICEPVITIKSVANKAVYEQMEMLAEALRK